MSDVRWMGALHVALVHTWNLGARTTRPNNATLHYTTLLYSTLLYSNLLYTALLYAIWRFLNKFITIGCMKILFS